LKPHLRKIWVIPPEQSGEFVAHMLEALIVLLAQTPRGVALIQDELSGLARAMDQYRRKGADRQCWLSFWNGAPVTVNRKSRQQPIVLDNLLVCVAGCLPPDVLGKISDER
jgi:hypothetical protein